MAGVPPALSQGQGLKGHFRDIEEAGGVVAGISGVLGNGETRGMNYGPGKRAADRGAAPTAGTGHRAGDPKAPAMPTRL